MADSEFRKKVLKLNSHRVSKITNSYGIYDGYKYYRKNKPKDYKFVLSESQYFSITRAVNNKFREMLLNGESVVFPYRIGSLDITKYSTKIEIKDGKIKTNLPIDWNATLELWEEDEESFSNKKLVRSREKEVYKIYYNKTKALFKNKVFYHFIPNRELKKALTSKIKENKIDAYLLKKGGFNTN